MKRLYEEILRRFPEIKPRVQEDDEDLPYVLLSYVVSWLVESALPTLSEKIIQRIIDFERWCQSQPRGQTAADDIPTIEMVALREKLFQHDQLLPLIWRLMSRQELLANREYLMNWVGADNYEAALRLTERKK